MVPLRKILNASLFIVGIAFSIAAIGAIGYFAVANGLINPLELTLCLSAVGIVTTAKATAVSTAITQVMRRQIRNTPSIWPALATRVDSTSDKETYGWLADVPGMQEFLGERIFKELRAFEYAVKNRSWEQSIGLNMEVVDDDRHGLYTPTAQRMTQKAARHPDKLMVELIVAGESGLCYDGQPFYDTAHEEGDRDRKSVV